MFFIGIFGTGTNVIPIKGVTSCNCPVCSKQVKMSATMKYNYFHIFFIPVFKYSKEYICTCPACASAFLLKEEIAKTLDSDFDANISESDLFILKDNYSGRCPGCGFKNPSSANFCQNCGISL